MISDHVIILSIARARKPWFALFLDASWNLTHLHNYNQPEERQVLKDINVNKKQQKAWHQ